METFTAGHSDGGGAVGGRRKLVIGLAGAIGSGKSTAAAALAEAGCAVIDADVLARQALQEPQVRQALEQWWGPSVLDDQGRVDRRAVARIVFDQPQELKRLEGLIHPRVHARRQVLRRQYEADPAVRAIVEDCPLLFEAGLDRDCDVVLCIRASEAVRLERVHRSRGWDEAELRRREKNQWPLDMKAQRADHVLDNDAGEAELKLHVRRVLSEIIQPQA